ncbi:hypothetical protein G6F37_005289 [Rhizopus arrhizus]|nr:hypothetical protein G6F38_001102 [Rhizopus arrhizus]KAG1159007.1 hypothetical protein G6F37_005289 [Rhizopus arrhizus]
MTQQFKYFDQQVAGHDKLMLFTTSTDDLILVKPCKKQEIEFYQDAQTYPSFLDLIPQCYGTLRTATESDLSMLESPGDSIPDCIFVDSVQEEQNICLENILHGFTRPCIMDLKMGALLYDEHATEEKRKKMIEQSINTTSHSLGLRICGMKVYDTVEHRYASYGKIYGKTRTNENTLEAILAYLFPTSHYGLATEDYRTYIPDDNEQRQIHNEPVPSKYMQWIIECFIDTLEEIKETLISLPNVRLISSSLLFVYEGSREAAESTWKYMLDEDHKESKEKGKGKQKAEDQEEEELAPKMCDLRLIDFAHSDFHAPRSEQDPDLIKGFDNMIRILSDCLKVQRQEKL